MGLPNRCRTNPFDFRWSIVSPAVTGAKHRPQLLLLANLKSDDRVILYPTSLVRSNACHRPPASSRLEQKSTVLRRTSCPDWNEHPRWPCSKARAEHQSTVYPWRFSVGYLSCSSNTGALPPIASCSCRHKDSNHLCNVVLLRFFLLHSTSYSQLSLSGTYKPWSWIVNPRVALSSLLVCIQTLHSYVIYERRVIESDATRLPYGLSCIMYGHLCRIGVYFMSSLTYRLILTC